MEKFFSLNSIYLRGAHLVIYCKSFLNSEYSESFYMQYKEFLKDMDIVTYLIRHPHLQYIQNKDNMTPVTFALPASVQSEAFATAYQITSFVFNQTYSYLTRVSSRQGAPPRRKPRDEEDVLLCVLLEVVGRGALVQFVEEVDESRGIGGDPVGGVGRRS